MNSNLFRARLDAAFLVPFLVAAAAKINLTQLVKDATIFNFPDAMNTQQRHLQSLLSGRLSHGYGQIHQLLHAHLLLADLLKVVHQPHPEPNTQPKGVDQITHRPLLVGIIRLGQRLTHSGTFLGQRLFGFNRAFNQHNHPRG